MSTFAVFGITLELATAEARKNTPTTKPNPDWCIAQVEGIKVELTSPNYGNGTSLVFITGTDPLYRPSTNWEDGGWLIGKHQVNLHSPQACDDCWAAWVTLQGKDFCQGAY